MLNFIIPTSGVKATRKTVLGGKSELEAAPALGNSLNCIPIGAASKNRHCLLPWVEVVFLLSSLPDPRFPYASLPALFLPVTLNF